MSQKVSNSSRGIIRGINFPPFAVYRNDYLPPLSIHMRGKLTEIIKFSTSDALCHVRLQMLSGDDPVIACTCAHDYRFPLFPLFKLSHQVSVDPHDKRAVNPAEVQQHPPPLRALTLTAASPSIGHGKSSAVASSGIRLGNVGRRNGKRILDVRVNRYVVPLGKTTKRTRGVAARG